MAETPPTTNKFSQLPLDEMLDLPVHEMTPADLVELVQQLHVMSVSAQTRRASLVKEGVEKHGADKKKTKKQKNNVELAMDLLNQLMS